jgi:hypothetical protein
MCRSLRLGQHQTHRPTTLPVSVPQGQIGRNAPSAASGHGAGPIHPSTIVRGYLWCKRRLHWVA